MARGYARGGYQVLAEAMITTGVNGIRVDASKVINGYKEGGYTVMADNLQKKLDNNAIFVNNIIAKADVKE